MPEDKPATNLERQEELVDISDLRALSAEERPNLIENGIQLCKVKVPGDIDWTNQEEVLPSCHLY